MTCRRLKSIGCKIHAFLDPETVQMFCSTSDRSRLIAQTVSFNYYQLLYNMLRFKDLIKGYQKMPCIAQLNVHIRRDEISQA